MPDLTLYAVSIYNIGMKLSETHEAVSTYLTHLLHDYRTYRVEAGHPLPEDMDADASYHVVPGTKYLKVVKNMYGDSDSVHSFIVRTDVPKLGFVAGDILKAATWKAPATNYTRGNVFTPNTYVERARWTGVS